MTAHNLSNNQQLVFKLLQAHKVPLGAYEILDHLRSQGVRAPLQVYRALEKLIEYGMVHRLESINAFVVCSHPRCEDHALAAFAICEKCGLVTEFADEKVAHSIHHHMHDIGFKARSTVLEIRGMCKACSK